MGFIMRLEWYRCRKCGVFFGIVPKVLCDDRECSCDGGSDCEVFWVKVEGGIIVEHSPNLSLDLVKKIEDELFLIGLK